MLPRLSPLVLLALCLTATPAHEAVRGARTQIAANYPEGPLIIGRTVFFAEMHKDRIVAWTGNDTKVFYESAGCGPTAIAPHGQGYAVLCHRPNEVRLISPTGKQLTRLNRDSAGRPFVNPNDASADANGGVWFSASGVFSRAAGNEGALMYLSARGTIQRVADNLHYPNGVYFDRRTRRLFVSEHLSHRILVYPEIAPGRLGRPAVFRRFREEKKAEGGTDLMGPDGLETDRDGNLFVAYYGAGLLFILSPEGNTLLRLTGQEPLITNIALNGCDLIITGARRTARQPYPGSVRRVDNPLCHAR